MSIKNYKGFKKIQEVRTAKKCKVLDFRPIRNSEVYKDMMELGFLEVIAENPAGIDVTGTAEQRYFKDRLGNIGFFHPSLERPGKRDYPYFNIKHNTVNDKNSSDYGMSYLTIRVCTGPSKSGAEFPRLAEVRRSCVTLEDYFDRMGFLIKYLVRSLGFPVTENELYSDESYQSLISRNLEENPALSSKLPVVPSSIKKSSETSKGSSLLKSLGAFDDED